MAQLSDVALAIELQAEWKPNRPDVTVIRTKARHNRRTTIPDEEWQRGDRLGEGGYGRVYLEECVTGNSMGKIRAVKQLRKARSKDYHHELNAIALFSLGKYTDSFVKCFGWYETEQHIFLTMEYLPHGDLQQYLDQPLPEQESQLITIQLLEALVHMHERNFTHRDLKPANILVCANGPSWWVKLADFGISKRTEEGITSLRTAKGTQNFAAPEIRLSSSAPYTNAVDIWGAGIIALITLVGMPRMDFPSILRYSVGAERLYPDEMLITQNLSQDGRAFIRSLLERDPSSRPSASQALQHNWLSSTTSPTDNHVNDFATWSTANSLPTVLPTARWSVNQSEAISQETVIPIRPIPNYQPTAQTTATDNSQYAQLEPQFSYQSFASQSDEGYGTTSGSIFGGERRLIRVKASIDRKLKTIELPLKDLDENLLPLQLRQKLDIPSNSPSEIYWFSDEIGDFEKLEESKADALRKIMEAARSKDELFVKIIRKGSQEQERLPHPPPRPQHMRSTSTLSAMPSLSPALSAPSVPPRPVSAEPGYFPPPSPQYTAQSPPARERKESWWRNLGRKERKPEDLPPEERPMYVARPMVMEVYIAILTGKPITLEVLQSDTILNVKQKIYAQEGIPVYLQHLMFAGKELEDIHSLHQYDIENHSILQLVLRLAK